MAKQKSLDQLQTEREKLEEMHTEARENYMNLQIAYDEAHEEIRAEQKKLKAKKAKEYKQRLNARKAMKNIQPTMKFLKSEIQKLDKQIKQKHGAGTGGMRKVANG